MTELLTVPLETEIETLFGELIVEPMQLDVVQMPNETVLTKEREQRHLGQGVLFNLGVRGED